MTRTYSRTGLQLACGIVLLVTGTAAAGAQGAPRITAGLRVRITHTDAAEPSPIIGTVLQRDADSLVLRVAGSERRVAVAYPQLSGLALSRGMKSRTAKGAGIGFLVGAAVGGILGATASSDGGCCMGGGGPNMILAAVGSGVLGIGGLVVGSVIGAHHPIERWESLPPIAWSTGDGHPPVAREE